MMDKDMCNKLGQKAFYFLLSHKGHLDPLFFCVCLAYYKNNKLTNISGIIGYMFVFFQYQLFLTGLQNYKSPSESLNPHIWRRIFFFFACCYCGSLLCQICWRARLSIFGFYIQDRK